MTALMQTYARLPVAFERGEGACLYDNQGRAYLDALSGISVCNLGHAHPAVTRAISEQANRLVHTSNLYRIPPQEALAEELCGLAGMDRVFFSNSGAEANEAAIKLARVYGHNNQVKMPGIVVTEEAFHGRTSGALSATANPAIRSPFEPLLQGFYRIPYNDLAALENLADQQDDIVAVLVEPILGEGGIIIPDEGYLSGIRSICDRQGWLMMLDEVQTGNGRTGHFFAYQSEGILPDVVTTAKGLGNGMPIGATLARGKAAEALSSGSHGSTFGGNFLACAAARAVIRSIQTEGLLARVRELGQLVQNAFTERLKGVNQVKAIRSRGLMIGIELARPTTTDLVAAALQRGLLINVIRNQTIRLLPPFVISNEQALKMVDVVTSLIKEEKA